MEALMDQTDFYRQLGWTGERAKTIDCPVCGAEHLVTSQQIDSCDVCDLDFKSKDQDD